LQAATRQPPAVILIEGEAGIGKTRLIRDWLAGPELAGTVQLLGHCTPLREPLPFGPVIDALASAAGWLPEPASLSPVTGALRPLLPELADRLPPPLPPLGSRRQERHRLFRGIRDLLTGIGPAVLVLEDLHWTDTGTQELLRFLAARLPPQLRLVLSYRREDLADPSTPALLPPVVPAASSLLLALQPLTAPEIRELADAVYQRRVSPGFGRYLHEHTMGIPLVVEAALGLLRDRQQPGDRPAAPEYPLPPETLPVPAALRDALLERVARLNRSARLLLHAATILGNPVTEQVLVRVAGVSGRHSSGGLATLVERGLLHPVGEDRYGFRHRLAQQAVHDSLAEPTRRALHRRCARVLSGEQPRPLDQLAHHCRRAGLVADWQRYAEAAADQSIALGDDDTAARLLHDLVTHPGASVRDRVRVALKLGRAALTGLHHSQAIEVLQRTLAEADLPVGARGELRLCLGVLLRNQARRCRAGWAELARAIEELAGRPAPAARAMASLGAPYLTDGRHLTEHLDWLDRAVETAHRAGDPQLTAVVEANRVAALISIGDPAGWQRAGPMPQGFQGPPGAHPPAGPLGTQPLLTVNTAWSAWCVGRYAEAGALLRAAEQLIGGDSGDGGADAVRVGSYLGCALSGTTLLYDYAVGNWEGLSARADEMATTVSDVASVVAEARLVRGLVALATGELREAEAHLAAATGSVPVVAAALAGRARLAAAAGDLAGAGELVVEGLALVRGKGVWCWSAELLPAAATVLARRCDHHPALRKLLDEIAAGITGRDCPLADAALAAGRAILAEAGGALLEAAAQHAEAAWAYGALPRPYAAAQAWEARGRCLLAAGRDGTAALAEAVTTFDRLGASWDVARCRHLLRSQGHHMPQRRGRPGYGGQLSPREQEVVRLVRTGLTNREVAEALFLSPRTVEAHVARALRKLGLRSRLALRRAPRSAM
jgi:DNA-binding CsgD family transcriptional regulator/tetratricopeptide (TPR) repeat protein